MSIIVIVDDRSINRNIYSKLAQSISSDVETLDFPTAEEALEWLAKNRADLIITDHDMPAMDGAEFISKFRALPRAQNVPVMMITVNTQRTARLRALECGATDFLRSPIDHYEFLMRARNLLSLTLASGIEPSLSEPAPAKVEVVESKPAGPIDVFEEMPERKPDWRLAPRLDLNSGVVVGVRVLRDGHAAQAEEPDALEVALNCIKTLQARRRETIRFTLAARLCGKGALQPLHLTGALAKAGISPHWLDLRVGAGEIVANAQAAESAARGFVQMGVGLSVDLDGPCAPTASGEPTPTLEAFIETFKPALVFAAGVHAEEAARRAQLLAQWRGRKALVLVAEGVADAATLRMLRHAGVGEAQGGCFGAPFAPRDLPALIAPARGEALRRSA